MQPAWTENLEELANDFVGDVSNIHWPTNRKIIHDTVWGTQSFEDWEVAIIDMPLVQRLRYIHQTSLAYLTFPTALHTRFDHSLGVCSGTKMLAKEVLDLKKKDESLWHHLIAAALLHDIGHGPFSHLSEEVYAFKPNFFDNLIYNNSGVEKPPFPNGSPHEVIGALLLRTEAVEHFFDQLNSKYNIRLDPALIGDIIAGNGYPNELAASSLVNGPFDADKIDYLRRDSAFSGVPIALDFERLLHSLELHDNELAVRIRGVVSAEQILFGKATLYSTVYHHHKVRASDCLYKGIVERMFEIGQNFNGRTLDNPADMLRFIDADFTKWPLKVHQHDQSLDHLLKLLSRRELPIRILELSTRAVEEQSLKKLFRFRNPESSDTHTAYNELYKIRQKIFSVLQSKFKKNIDMGEIWIDLPNTPKLGEGSFITEKGELKLISEVFPTSRWVDYYKLHRYVGYVFGPRRYKEIVKKAAKEVLEQEGIFFK